MPLRNCYHCFQWLLVPYNCASKLYIWHKPSLHGAPSAQAMGHLSWLIVAFFSSPGLMDGQHKHDALQDRDGRADGCVNSFRGARQESLGVRVFWQQALRFCQASMADLTAQAAYPSSAALPADSPVQAQSIEEFQSHLHPEPHWKQSSRAVTSFFSSPESAVEGLLRPDCQ